MRIVQRNGTKGLITNQSTNNMAYNSNVLPNSDSESGNDTNNNLYEGPFEKSVSNDNMSNGMGIAVPATEKVFEDFPGSGQSETNKLRMREMARFNSLKPAMGMNITINNAGIPLDSFGGVFSEKNWTNSRGEHADDKV